MDSSKVDALPRVSNKGHCVYEAKALHCNQRLQEKEMGQHTFQTSSQQAFVFLTSH